MMKRHWILLLALYIPAHAEVSNLSSTYGLLQCVTPVLLANKYASAEGTSYNACRTEEGKWLNACRDTYDPEHSMGNTYDKCNADLRELLHALERDVERKRPKSQPRPNPIDVAMQDLNAGLGLPGLPNLKVPVYVAKNTLICSSLGTLSNPNVDVLLVTGACALLDHRMRVSVLVPADAQTYIESYVFGAIAVEWRAEEMSNATVRRGWLRTSALQN